MFWFLNEGVDGFLFEIYYDFEELKIVFILVRKEMDKFIIIYVFLYDIGVL